jgi:hypothetical protein
MNNLHENIFKFMTKSRWILLRMQNVLDESCREIIKENNEMHRYKIFLLNILHLLVPVTFEHHHSALRYRVP